MRMNNTKLHFILLLLALVLIFPPRAHAYLDPGTGSYILQIAAATIFGGLFFLKTFWRQITDFIGKLLGKGKKSEKDSSKDK